MDFTPEKVKEDSKDSMKIFLSSLNKTVYQIEKLEKVIKDCYKPKKEFCDISSNLSLLAEKLKSEKLRSWLIDLENSSGCKETEVELRYENQNLKAKIQNLEEAQRISQKPETIQIQCEECVKVQTLNQRRAQLTTDMSFAGFQKITEEDWNIEVFPKCKTKKEHAWEISTNCDVILPCSVGIVSNNKEINRAIDKFGGRNGLQEQNKKEGDVAIMAHSIGFPDPTGNIREIGAGIVVLSEPNKRAIANKNDWIYDADLDTAIKILDRNIAVKNQGSGKNFCYVTTPSFTIYGCYASPNKKIEELSDILEQIGNCIRTRGVEAIVVGDFNAKSPQWGMMANDARGQLVSEWIAEHDLIVKNVGKKPTFQRNGYGSILDLTLATTGIGRKITHWETEQFTLLWILLIMIVMGNSAVLITLLLNKTRKSRMNFFIKQLAIADLLVGLINVLTDIIWRITVTWYAGNVACKCIRFSQAVVTYASTYVLVALSIDRYDAITHPMNFSGSWRRARVLITTAWTLSFLFSIPMLFLFEEKPIQGQLQCWIDLTPIQWRIYMTIISIVLFLIPALVISACYTVIVRTIWSKSNILLVHPTTSSGITSSSGHHHHHHSTNRGGQLQQQQHNNNHQQNHHHLHHHSGNGTNAGSHHHHSSLSQRNHHHVTSSGSQRNHHNIERTLRDDIDDVSDCRRASSRGIIPKAKIKTIKMTFVIVFVFVLCWSPYIVFDLLQVYGYIPRTQTNIALATFIQSLAPLNSAANPIIYCLFSTHTCRSIKNIPPFKWFWCCCFCNNTAYNELCFDYRSRSRHSRSQNDFTRTITTSLTTPHSSTRRTTTSSIRQQLRLQNNIGNDLMGTGIGGANTNVTAAAVVAAGTKCPMITTTTTLHPITPRVAISVV
ncbi:uncharacterized protein LOC123292172 [Chrysoperla carnea]|uniref:uncharacterized protein LOC123292172 n=1 Tax=Chrysoperla carnea TaxID=189513 RepID=UPI001D08B266|nr:uncharacterized protein LOC123292172 [Chrysoperla carnea]